MRWLAFAALALLGPWGEAVAVEPARTGRAYDASSGLPLYEERHFETVSGGRLLRAEVRYVDAAGAAFATKRVDFGAHPFLPEFELANRRTGHLEALHRTGEDALVVRFREGAGRDAREARLSAPEDALADAGFDRFVETHWERLLAGGRIVRRFLVPSRLEFLDVRIRRSDDGSEPERVSFALEMDSALLRLVVPAVTVSYERTSRRLLSYEGPSNLRDERGENLTVFIEFEYPGTRGAHMAGPGSLPREEGG